MDTISTPELARQLATSQTRIRRAAARLGLGEQDPKQRWRRFTVADVEQITALLGFAPSVPGRSREELFILKALLLRPMGLLHVRDVARAASISPTTASRGLARLLEEGLVSHDVERVTLGRVQDTPVWRHRLYSSAGAPIIDAVRSVVLPAATPKTGGRRVPKRLDHLFWNLDRPGLDTRRDGKLIANRLLSSDDTEALGFLATGAIPTDELERAAATPGIDPSLAAMARNIAAYFQ
jgi:DNA-binding transcriptional ArsR family regulator